MSELFIVLSEEIAYRWPIWIQFNLFSFLPFKKQFKLAAGVSRFQPQILMLPFTMPLIRNE
jgi:hypothetical protein